MISASPTVASRSRALAEQAALERLLNCYLRETGVPDPRLHPADAATASLPPDLYADLQAQGMPMRLQLRSSGTVLLGAITYLSAAGHHQFGPRFWTQAQAARAAGPGAGSAGYRPVAGVTELADLLVSDLAAAEPDTSLRQARRRSLLEQIANSIEKTALYVEHYLRRGRPRLDPEAADRLLAAEQSLVFGHPFHPTPKSSEGFSPADLARYAPELGAGFTLHYFAAAPELVQEQFLPETGGEAIPAAILTAARDRLPARRGWRLLPCHPWQAAHLCQLPGVAALMGAGRLVHLGPLGGPVYPTSSVRTVWLPDHRCFFKLPLGVRITNFIRVNPADQLRRSLDASRALAALQGELAQPGFTVLLEDGYRTVAPPDWEPAARAELAASLAVLFRRAPAPAGPAAPMVLAALLEPPPHGGEPPIVAALRLAANTQDRGLTPEFVATWLRRYLEIALLPLLRLFLEGGICLEAHVQNAMLALAGGWPAGFYVRDLEGAAISRERAAARGLYGGRVTEESPALYPDAHAWHRLQYYVVVNHLGHLLFTLARYGAGEERRLWQVVRRLLEEQAPLFRRAGGAHYLEELLDGPGLPAKANLISRFQERGETPVYVPIPNPMRTGEVS